MDICLKGVSHGRTVKVEVVTVLNRDHLPPMNSHVEVISELLRPVVQSAGCHEWDLERPNSIEIPDLTLEE